MKSKIIKFFCLALCLGLFSCGDDDRKAVDLTVKQIAKTNHSTKVWAHFMLWYETPASIGEWGQHWSKGEPVPVQQDGAWQNLYTRYAPLTGPYYSRDKVILEYQLLLMKYSGIDGVIADWYGLGDGGSKEDKTAALAALYAMCKETGVELAVCYEDRFKTGTDAERIASIKDDMAYLQANYFIEPIHSKIDGQPLLLIFGPKVEGTGGLTAIPENWNQCFENITPKPIFYPLQGKQGSLITGGVAKSTYNWSNNSNMSGSDTYYTTSQFAAGEFVPQLPNIFVAMPGFNDCYNGVSGTPRYRITPHNGGTFFQQQLDLAAQYKPKYLQLCTWNDYGEGTIIEPTVSDAAQNNNNPYIYLEQLHSFTGVTSASKDILPHIKRLYDLRAANRGDAKMNERLDLAFMYFRSVQPDKAIEQLNKIQQ